MKTLSLRPEWAHLLLTGEKTVEVRSWKTDYRGDILIVSSAAKRKGLISGYALIVYELVDIVPMTEKYLEEAYMEEIPEGNYYAWLLDNPKEIIPFPVKGKLHLYDTPDDLIKYTHTETEEEAEEVFNKYWKPLFDKA